MTPLPRTSGPHTPRNSLAVRVTTPTSAEPVVEPRRPTPRPAARSGAAWVAFARAVDRLCADEERVRPDGVSHEVLADALALVEAAVHAAADGQPPTLGAVPGFVYANRVAGSLRETFLQEVASAGASDATELVRILLAFERVEQALEADAGQRFLTKLSGIEAPKLLAEVAHDMRSPLGSILFLAEHLRTGGSGAVNAIQSRQLGLIYSAALGLSGMTSDVMELARGGDRLAAHPPIPFSVAEVVDGALAIVRPMAEEKGLELKTTLPDADFRLGHPTALGRVLLNLVTNALKFTSSGSVHVVVEQVERTALRFTVQDTGRGIPPQVLTTLCDSFRTRAETGNGYSFSSAGLGLSICHKLISAMGGELGVDTELEKGTRFFFQLELPPAPRM